jgi:hypothetical protein
MITRRTFLGQMSGLLVVGTGARWVSGPAVFKQIDATPITVYKSSTCGCCAKWVDHIRANDFAPEVHDDEEMERRKDSLGVPMSVRSCHTAKLEGYLIEGHVPASDIRRLLTERPKVAGLAVPQMPSGTPGMAPPGAPIEGFDVIAFQASGASRIFSRY